MSKYGVVYIAQNKERDPEDVFKVGYSHDPEKRMEELNGPSSNYGRFETIATFSVNDMQGAEGACHDALAEYRIKSEREFFKLEKDKVIAICTEAVSGYKAKDIIPETKEIPRKKEVCAEDLLDSSEQETPEVVEDLPVTPSFGRFLPCFLWNLLRAGLVFIILGLILFAIFPEYQNTEKATTGSYIAVAFLYLFISHKTHVELAKVAGNLPMTSNFNIFLGRFLGNLITFILFLMVFALVLVSFFPEYENTGMHTAVFYAVLVFIFLLIPYVTHRELSEAPTE